MNWHRSRATTLALAVYSASHSNSALSEAVISLDDTQLETIVVTGSRTLQRVLDSPNSLSVINADDLAQTTVSSPAELLRDIPGVQVTDSGQPGLGRIRIRGEESRRTAILVNNQEITDHYEVGTPLTLHPAMIERIEVQRGSGSVLYGARALSGVVNFFTRKGGTEPLQATIEGGYDSATQGYNSFASVYGNAKGLEYRIAVTRSDHEDRSTPAGTMDNTAYDNDSVYFFTGKTFASHRFEYNYENYHSNSDIFVEEALKSSFPITDFFLQAPQRDREKHGIFYTWDADNTWLNSLEANAYIQDSDRHFYTYTETVWYSRDINSYSTLDTEGALIQMNFKPLGNHSFIAGLQYGNDEVDQTRVVDTLAWTPLASTGISIIDDEATIKTWAVFVQDQWQVSDYVSLTAGMRQYYVDGQLNASNRDSLNAGRLNSEGALIGALGLVWEIDKQLHFRSNLSQGYVYPFLTQLATGAYAGSSYVNPDPDLEAETSINFELGLRMQRRGVTLDMSAFFTESHDYINHLPCKLQDNCNEPRDRLYQNVGRSNAHGVELYVAYNELAYNLEPYASVTWMERKIEYADFSTWNTEVPSWSGRLGLKWEGPLASRNRLWADAYLRGESSSKHEEPGSLRSEMGGKAGWMTINLSSGISFGKDGQYQLSADLLNLTDKKYIASTENLYGAERSIAFKLTLNW